MRTCTHLVVLFSVVICAALSDRTAAFQSRLISSRPPVLTTTRSFHRSASTQLQAASYDNCLEIGYMTKCPKPLGIVFGENKDPYYGLVVDDVAEGQNGGRAGLRLGDQLMAVNGQVVVGKNFDSVMTILQNAEGTLDLVMYRGPVASMYTILSNQMGDDEFLDDDEEDEGEEAIVMDENYESPVKIEVKERKPLTPGDFFKAAAKVGKMLMEDDSDAPPEVKKEKKKKQGFFGIGAEAIQLDGDDANTLK